MADDNYKYMTQVDIMSCAYNSAYNQMTYLYQSENYILGIMLMKIHNMLLITN